MSVSKALMTDLGEWQPIKPELLSVGVVTYIWGVS